MPGDRPTAREILSFRAGAESSDIPDQAFDWMLNTFAAHGYAVIAVDPDSLAHAVEAGMNAADPYWDHDLIRIREGARVCLLAALGVLGWEET